MKLNQSVAELIISTFIFVMILWTTFIIMNWHRLLFIVITLIITLIVMLYSIYVQKTHQPHCKHCDQALRVKEMKLIGQDEKVKRGRFVLYYKYEYNYQCPHCEVVIYKKTVKDKSHLTIKSILSDGKSKIK